MGFKETYLAKKSERAQFIAALNPKSFDFQLATWFGSGLLIPAPGTWGTIGGMVFGIPLLFLTNALVVFIAGIILFFVGLKSVERIEQKIGGHDPSFIVIDEVAAILLLISLIPHSNTELIPALISFLGAFILFRFFDAKKPWIIGVVDQKITGAWGVMLDDILAALFTYITYWIIFGLLLIFFTPGIN